MRYGSTDPSAALHRTRVPFFRIRHLRDTGTFVPDRVLRNGFLGMDKKIRALILLRFCDHVQLLVVNGPGGIPGRD